MDQKFKNYQIISNTLGDPFFKVPKQYQKHFRDCNTVVILEYIISKRKYFVAKGEIKFDEPFFLTQTTISEDTYLSLDIVSLCIKKFIKEGILTFCGKKGLPARNFYQVNDEKLIEILTDEE